MRNGQVPITILVEVPERHPPTDELSAKIISRLGTTFPKTISDFREKLWFHFVIATVREPFDMSIGDK